MIRRIWSWTWPILGIAVAVGILYIEHAGYLIPQPSPEGIAEDIIVQINDEREALGLEPLVVNEHLMQMARWRSEDMVAGGYVGHDPPEGHPTLRELSARLGYDSKPEENIVTMRLVAGRRLDEVARKSVVSWKGSPGHWDWVTSPYEEMTGVGVAVGDGYVVVTQLFWGASMFTPSAAYEHNRDPSMSVAPGRELAFRETMLLVNSERAKAGLPLYQSEFVYSTIAEDHAEQIVERQQHEHWEPGGPEVITVTLDAGEEGQKTICAEIKTANELPDPYLSAAAAVDSWMQHDAQRAVVLHNDYGWIGIDIIWSGSESVYVILACLDEFEYRKRGGGITPLALSTRPSTAFTERSTLQPGTSRASSLCIPRR